MSTTTTKPARSLPGTAVYLFRMADAIPVESFATDLEALEFEERYNANQPTEPKFIAVADVDRAIRRSEGGGV